MHYDGIDVPEALRSRVWYRPNHAYAFLVDAPITFGHSQLRMLVGKGETEDIAFSKAAKHIVACMIGLRTCLPKALSSQQPLAKYTNTSGDYVKTLVLKVSADESKSEYKVHLVPFFQSHLNAAGRLFRATHDQPKPKTGGLIHWLGHRELLVDYDMRDRKNSATRQRIEAFRLDALAMRLKNSV